jgi:hypothetical protein
MKCSIKNEGNDSKKYDNWQVGDETYKIDL